MNINKSPRRIKEMQEEERKIQLLNYWEHQCINLKLKPMESSTVEKNS